MSAFSVRPSLLNPGPFAAIPYEVAHRIKAFPLAANVLTAILDYAKDKDHCWPSDRTLADWVDASVGHVKRAVRFMEQVGVISRERDYRNAVNRTNRIIRLVWRSGRACTGAPVIHKASLREEEKENGGPSGPAAEGPPSGPPGQTEEDPPAPGVIAALWARLRAAPPPPPPPPKDPAAVSPRASLSAAAPKALEAAESRRRELAAQLASLGVRPRQGPPETPPGTAMEGYVPPFHPKE